VDKLQRQSRSSVTIAGLISKVLRVLRISAVGSFDLSLQHELQLEEPHNILYIEGGWLTSFLFDVSNCNPYCDVALCTLDNRVYSAALLETIRATQAIPATDPSAFCPFQYTAKYCRHHSRGFLGHFTLSHEQMLERCFENPYDVPRMELIHPLWAQILRLVEEAGSKQTHIRTWT